MPNEVPDSNPCPVPDLARVLAELEVPFPPQLVQWRVTNTSQDKKRGQIVPYADPRAYTDRLNGLFTPQGWTRTYAVETMNNITRLKKGESIVTGKVLVTCTVVINGLGSHSGTGEEWADDDNGMTAADAQAFKRACSCFGLGRYLYYFVAPWVDLDQNRQPMKVPALPAWAIPENWREGKRPVGNHGAGCVVGNGANHHEEAPPTGNGRAAKANGNGHRKREDSGTSDLDARILAMEQVIGPGLYRSILREHGRANQPKLIRDASAKRRVVEVLESASRGFERLNRIRQRLDPETVEGMLAKLQAPRLEEIADMKTLQLVVFGLEQLAAPLNRSAG
jgi:hypothetical protein